MANGLGGPSVRKKLNQHPYDVLLRFALLTRSACVSFTSTKRTADCALPWYNHQMSIEDQVHCSTHMGSFAHRACVWVAAPKTPEAGQFYLQNESAKLIAIWTPPSGLEKLTRCCLRAADLARWKTRLDCQRCLIFCCCCFQTGHIKTSFGSFLIRPTEQSADDSLPLLHVIYRETIGKTKCGLIGKFMPPRSGGAGLINFFFFFIMLALNIKRGLGLGSMYCAFRSTPILLTTRGRPTWRVMPLVSIHSFSLILSNHSWLI